MKHKNNKRKIIGNGRQNRRHRRFNPNAGNGNGKPKAVNRQNLNGKGMKNSLTNTAGKTIGKVITKLGSVTKISLPAKPETAVSKDNLKSENSRTKPDTGISYQSGEGKNITRKIFGNGSGNQNRSAGKSGLIAAILLLAMLVTAALSSVYDAKANDESAEIAASQTSSLQLAKEYIYAGSRMLAIEDYGLGSGSTPTPSPTPAPTATPTTTPTPPTGSESVVWQNIQGTTPNGNSVTHSGETYYGLARSQQTISNSGYFEWTYQGFEDVWVGLGNNNDELPGGGYNDISYALNGEVREMGVYKWDVFPTVGDTLRIEIDANGTVTYKKNGTVIYTSETSASGSYYLVFKADETAGHGISNAMVGSVSTPTPTPTPTPSAGQAIVFDGNNFGEITLPNAAPFNSLGGFQIVWRVRNAANHQPDNLPGYIFNLNEETAVLAHEVASRFDGVIPQRTGDNSDALYMFPTNFSDSVCKLQYDPANSRWTFETWKADGTGHVSITTPIQNASNFNFGGQTLDIGASTYQHRWMVGKLDYWRWIGRVEALGVFPSAAPPTGVTYLLDYEFDGNGNDSSGNGLNLTLTNNPTFENTP